MIGPYLNNRVVSIIVLIIAMAATIYFLPAKVVNDYALSVIAALMLFFMTVRLGLVYVRPGGE